MSLTIKQAFEALSDACANGMKNPFFVMRRLKESFADVASKVVDASGDKVTVTQALTEGTEIGSIKVNNDTTTLYAPEGGGANYSTVEQKIGKWADNTDLYQLTVFADGADSSGYQNILELPADTYNIKEINYVFESGGGEVITGVWANSIMWQCAVAVANSQRYLMIKRQTNDAGWRTVKLICTIKYTKSTT